MTSYPSVRAENAYVRIGTERRNVQLYPEQRICDDLGVPNMAYMNPNQVMLVWAYCMMGYLPVYFPNSENEYLFIYTYIVCYIN